MTPARLPFAVLLAGLLLATSQVRGQEEPDARTSQEILGKRSSIALETRPAERVGVSAGSRLHVEPDHEAPVLATVRTDLELEVLRREEDWAEVRYDAFQGWIFTGDETTGHGSMLDRPGWLIESTDDGARRFREAPVISPQLTAARLDRLREVLGDQERELAFGPYRLFTDVRNDSLIGELEATVGSLETTYRDRFGLHLDEVETQAVVLFAREETYRAYEQEVPEISDLATLGHQSHGVAVTFVGGRSVTQVRRILLHELTHLLNRRALPLVLPSWLEEGLAEDLSFSRVDSQGHILTSTVQGIRVRSLTSSRISGGFASLAALLKHYRRPTWPKITTLVDANWEDFVQPSSRPAYYTQAAFFIRFLIDRREGAHADVFRDYLRQVAEAGPDETDLWAALEVPKDQIEARYDAWIWNHGRAYGVVSEFR